MLRQSEKKLYLKMFATRAVFLDDNDAAHTPGKCFLNIEYGNCFITCRGRCVVVCVVDARILKTLCCDCCCCFTLLYDIIIEIERVWLTVACTSQQQKGIDSYCVDYAMRLTNPIRIRIIYNLFHLYDFPICLLLLSNDHQRRSSYHIEDVFRYIF